MLKVDDYATIRLAYRDGMSIRQIASTFRHSRSIHLTQGGALLLADVGPFCLPITTAVTRATQNARQPFDRIGPRRRRSLNGTQHQASRRPSGSFPEAFR